MADGNARKSNPHAGAKIQDDDATIAAMLEDVSIPTLALFGPMDPALWSPLGPRVRTVRSEPLAALETERLLTALRAMLADIGC